VKKKEFTVNGATIMVLQVDDWLDFSMQIKSLRFFHCNTYKGKIEDITEEDAIETWNRYHEKVGKLDDAWIAELKKNSRRRKPWKKRKKSSSDSSEPLIREIRP
jgi:hypothetical protein